MCQSEQLKSAKRASITRWPERGSIESAPKEKISLYKYYLIITYINIPPNGSEGSGPRQAPLGWGI